MTRAGKKAFERCDVKVVEFKDFVYIKGETGKAVLSTNPSEDTRVGSGSSAVLHCPRTEDDKVRVESQFTNHDTRLAALKSVKQLAGELLCSDCRFSAMTPVEVSEERAKLARAEAERLQAFKLVESARQELQSTFPNLPSPTADL